MHNILLYLWVLSLSLQSAICFNIDIGTHITHTIDQKDSWFGFAVAMHRDRDGGKLLVGAPKYDTDQVSMGVYNAGGVLNCSPRRDNDCRYIPFDRNGNNRDPMGNLIDDKNDQWFGATLVSSGETGIVLACAPRYRFFNDNFERIEPVGTCIVARDSLTDFEKFSPCQNEYFGYHRQGYCQAGFSAAITKNGSRIFIGAPGAFYWQGQIHYQSLTQHNDFKYTWEGPASEDDQYMGYASISGEFTGDRFPDVAFGVPKGLNYTGKIALYSHDFVPLQNISGYQLGSYFGYCLSVVDFNGDGLDDLVVGAPLYTDYEDREMRYETGRVYVILQNHAHKFKRSETFNGEISKGRFGLSVAGIGDINVDGYGDIAVGAPYGGSDGNGAVYIYHGYPVKSGKKVTSDLKKPAQVIEASGLGYGISTFGWSLSGGLDMDNNSYPDLLVGAYESNQAFFFKSRPVVNLYNHYLSFDSEHKTIDINIDNLNNTNKCVISDGTVKPCIKLKFCIAYKGIGVADDIDMDIEYILDYNKMNKPRLFFVDSGLRHKQFTLRITKKKDHCRTHKVYVMPNVVDKLSEMTAKVNYSLIETSNNWALSPILNERQTLILTDSLNIQKNCGLDNQCVPDLRMSFDAPDKFILGEKEDLKVNLRVTNNGEDAFESKVHCLVPTGLSFKKFVPLDNSSVTCWQKDMEEGNPFVVCDVGNPLPMHKGAYFDLFFQQKGLMEKPQFEFLVTANSSNEEESQYTEDNVARKTITVEVDTKMSLYGLSDPEHVIYNQTLYSSRSAYSEETIGPQVIHRYGIHNKGPSGIDEAEIIILWPTRTKEKEYLFYLLEAPYTTGPVKCDPLPRNDLNPLGIKVNTALNLESQLASSRVESQTTHTKIQNEIELNQETEFDDSLNAYGSGSSTSSSSTFSKNYTTALGSGYEHSYKTTTYKKTSYSSSSSSSSNSYDSNYGYPKNYIRRKRSSEVSEFDFDKEASDCGPTACTIIHCIAGPLPKDQDIYIYVRSRLWLDTLEKELQYPRVELDISSKMLTRVTKLPQGLDPTLMKAKKIIVKTPVAPEKSLDEAPPVPWWVIILATMAGVIILLIIVLIFWKLGFFKRHRPSCTK